MDTVKQQQQQQDDLVKQKKNTLASRFNPFNWMNNKSNNNNNNKQGAQLQGNDMSIDNVTSTNSETTVSPTYSSNDNHNNNNGNSIINHDDIQIQQQQIDTNKNGYRILNEYYILETLGKGMSGKVKKGKHIRTNDICALKIIDRATARKRVLSQLHTEIMAMKSLNHPNILNLLHVSLNATYPRKCGETRQVMVIGLELAKGGELFDFMMYTGSFSEILARTFFIQMCQALSVCHSKMIFHRDIKPENLLLDDRYQLKVADFGLAAIRNDKEDLLRTECGTRSYMAPEILLHKEYNGAKADVWSCAVVLFIMLAGNPPFTMAKKGDWWFNALLENNYAKFWKAHKKYAAHFPPAAEAFLSTVLIPDPNMRPSIDEMLKHPWCQGPIFSDEDLYHELLRRKTTVDREKAREREIAIREKEAKKNSGKQFDPFATNATRSTGYEISEGESEVIQRYDTSIMAPKLMDMEIKGFTNFYTAAPALAIIDELKTAVTMMEGGNVMKTTTEADKEFSMKVQFVKGTDKCDMKINIYSVPEDKIQIVQMTRKLGDPFVFNKIYKEMLEKIPDLLVNDNDNDENVPCVETPNEEMLVQEVGMI